MKKAKKPPVIKTKAEPFQKLDLSSVLSCECLEAASCLSEVYESGALDILKDSDLDDTICEALHILKDATVAHYSASVKEIKKRLEKGLPA